MSDLILNTLAVSWPSCSYGPLVPACAGITWSRGSAAPRGVEFSEPVCRHLAVTYSYTSRLALDDGDAKYFCSGYPMAHCAVMMLHLLTPASFASGRRFYLRRIYSRLSPTSYRRSSTVNVGVCGMGQDSCIGVKWEFRWCSLGCCQGMLTESHISERSTLNMYGWILPRYESTNKVSPFRYKFFRLCNDITSYDLRSMCFKVCSEVE